MALAAPPSCAHYCCTPKRSKGGPDSATTSMSQGFHQGIFSFSDGFEQQQHIAQQSRRDRLRVQGFDPSGNLLAPVEEGTEERPGMYGHPSAGNMLSEMFDFPAPGTTSSDLLATQISPAARPAAVAGISGDWYGANHHHQQQQHDLMQGMSADSAAAMHLFLRNPPTQIQNAASSPQTFHAASFGGGAFSGGAGGEGQGLSLSLSSSLQPFQMAKAEEMRIGSDEVLYFNSNNQQRLQVHGQEYDGVMGSTNVLRNSRYARVAQELLEEFCSLGRGQVKGGCRSSRLRGSSNPNPSSSGGGGASSSAAVQSSSKEPPTLSSAERFEHQRKKAKLLSILDEVDRRYNHYCSQMQMVVNSFDNVMGFGAATPYTSMAQKAMSRHFRCRKDAIVSQLKHTCELLGDKDGAGGSGITKGETPRLRLLDQSLRQQRAFHQVGMMEQEAWRPQRGLPERSVTVLRAWLFEHFLHPYPSDADKHLLARQTGLSKNQVSNWFINARVRLWKPMVEDMYQQESKEEGVVEEEGSHQGVHSPTQQRVQGSSKTNAPESDLSQLTHHRFASSNPPPPPSVAVQLQAGSNVMPELCVADHASMGIAVAGDYGPVSAHMRLGATGDVSLTLGLRHAGNALENSRFTIRDFGDC